MRLACRTVFHCSGRRGLQGRLGEAERGDLLFNHCEIPRLACGQSAPFDKGVSAPYIRYPAGRPEGVTTLAVRSLLTSRTMSTKAY